MAGVWNTLFGGGPRCVVHVMCAVAVTALAVLSLCHVVQHKWLGALACCVCSVPPVVVELVGLRKAPLHLVSRVLSATTMLAASGFGGEEGYLVLLLSLNVSTFLGEPPGIPLVVAAHSVALAATPSPARLAFLLVSFPLVHSLASALKAEQQEYASAVRLVGLVAKALEGYDLETVNKVVSTSTSRHEILEHLHTLSLNLQRYRPYLPAAIFTTALGDEAYDEMCTKPLDTPDISCLMQHTTSFSSQMAPQAQVSLDLLELEGYKERIGTVMACAIDTGEDDCDAYRKAEYFTTAVLEEVKAEGGTVLALMADRVIASWNTHSPCPRHSHHACRAAWALQSSIKNILLTLSAGPLLTGHIGSIDYRAPFILGPAVKQARLLIHLVRLMSESGPYPILLTEEVHHRTKSSIETRPVDAIPYEPFADGGDIILIYELRRVSDAPLRATSEDGYMDYVEGFAQFKLGRPAQSINYLTNAAAAGDAQANRLLRLALHSKRHSTFFPKPYHRTWVGWRQYEADAMSTPIPAAIERKLVTVSSITSCPPTPNSPGSPSLNSPCTTRTSTPRSPKPRRAHNRTRVSEVEALRGEIEKQLSPRQGGRRVRGFEDTTNLSPFHAPESPASTPVQFLPPTPATPGGLGRSNPTLSLSAPDWLNCSNVSSFLGDSTAAMSDHSPVQPPIEPNIEAGGHPSPRARQRLKVSLNVKVDRSFNGTTWGDELSAGRSSPSVPLIHILDPECTTPDPVISSPLPVDTSSSFKTFCGPFSIAGLHAQNDTAEEATLPGIIVDKGGSTWYRSEKRLGRGAFGQVWLGMGDDGGLVALKTLKLPGEDEVDGDCEKMVLDLISEVGLLCSLRHENVVAYVSSAVVERHIVVVMEYLSGGSLQTVLDQFGKLPIAAVRRYLSDIIRGLSFLHSHRIVHRDVKPGNVLLQLDGQCKLADFGASSELSITEATTQHDVIGTPIYMSPEACRGVVTPASDIWAVGLVTYQMITAKIPFQFDDYEPQAFLWRMGAGEEEVLPVVNRDLLSQSAYEFIMGCLERDYTRRPDGKALLHHPFLLYHRVGDSVP
eukprot:Sspe_Gene.28655::Locus_13130_Transcript_1_1_Confidence_1.000_Length_3578::g.28655::m.28655